MGKSGQYPHGSMLVFRPVLWSNAGGNDRIPAPIIEARQGLE